MWRSIKTAPRDGTVFIAFVPDLGFVGAVLGSVWWEDAFITDDNDFRGLELKPTHWMPLPNPPRQ